MERTIARVTTMQSVNAKASKQEQNSEFVSECFWTMSDHELEANSTVVSELVKFVCDTQINSEMDLLETLETVAATLVMVSSKLREDIR